MDKQSQIRLRQTVNNLFFKKTLARSILLERFMKILKWGKDTLR